MKDTVFISQTKLSALGKKGKITPDKDGYYTLVVGGLECGNNTNSHYYTSQDVIQLFASGSLLHRRLQQGVVRAEVGHPKMRQDESMEQFCQRLCDIDLNNTCAHFRKIWLDMDYGKNNPHLKNPNLIAIMAEVKPEGGRGFILKEALENEHANIFFSIRSISDQKYVNGRWVRTIGDVITFDLVNEGGITVANKWDSPACESADFILPVTQSFIKKVMENTKETASMESAAYVMSVIESRFSSKEKKVRSIHRW